VRGIGFRIESDFPVSPETGLAQAMKSRSHLGQANEDSLTKETCSATFERHYTVAEVAGMWNLSEDAARRMFQNEPGVVVLANPTRGSKRRYRTLRIPLSVVERVHKRCSLVK
jgi:hypothetical protein